MTKLYLLDGIFISGFQIQGFKVPLLIKYVEGHSSFNISTKIVMEARSWLHSIC